ncbi:related to capsular associated protein [Melanopsichium pennsylvanicum]|uniref:Related to capsular associated protein n=2 Tax=Melanopsichium pennsylvanicum TaxID=63383 RepID=A0AAJ4XPV8_9BASI|nr:related to capsular associated protein [Melanopsichium pennsylvanicum 4]SNX86934.1 related to capsular associated protein [Melanopsichium pennsylvanicum]
MERNEASTRLRSNVVSPNISHEKIARDGHHPQHSTFQAKDMHPSSSRIASALDRGKTKIGWRVAGGLAVLGLFLLISNGVNRYDYTSLPSYLSSSNSAYKTAMTSMDQVTAKCAIKGIHPIACKVDHAAELASEMRSRQSTTVQQAVRAYKRRYLRTPPPGFGDWVEFALEHNATIIDDYDQIEIDLNTFRQAGLVGTKLRARILEAKHKLPGYEFGQLSVVGGQVVAFGPDQGPLSAGSLVDLLEPVQHLIPDVTIPFNWYAEPRMPHPDSKSSFSPLKSTNLAAQDPTDVLQRACPSNHIAPVRAWDAFEPPLDYCREDSDELGNLHGFLQAPISFHPLNKLVPMLSRSKLSNFADILAPNVCYGHWMYRGFPDTIPWEQKQDSVYWRGTTTGEAQTPDTWARGHRHRMLRYAKQLREAASKLTTGVEKDPFDKIYGSNRTIAPSRDSVHVAGNTLPLFDYADSFVVDAVKRLGAKSFNIAWNMFVLADNATMESLMANQVTTGTEDRNVPYEHKFLLDLDGQSMSCRFYQLLSSNSVVLKQTIWSEYHDERLVPWIHYVPLDLRVQNNELPMLLDFFINHAQGPATAAKIAAASKKWADATLRPIDVALYYARLLIEFAALYDQPV